VFLSALVIASNPVYGILSTVRTYTASNRAEAFLASVEPNVLSAHFAADEHGKPFFVVMNECLNLSLF
jgi:hypothetical protein